MEPPLFAFAFGGDVPVAPWPKTETPGAKIFSVAATTKPEEEAISPEEDSLGGQRVSENQKNFARKQEPRQALSMPEVLEALYDVLWPDVFVFASASSLARRVATSVAEHCLARDLVASCYVGLPPLVALKCWREQKIFILGSSREQEPS